MSLVRQLKTDLSQALRAGESLKVETLRGLLASLHNREIELRGKSEPSPPLDGLDDEEAIKVLRKEAKKRQEAAEIYDKANRLDLAEKEKSELEIVQSYLPSPLTDEEITAVIERVIAQGVKNFGQVMQAVVKETKGRADSQKIKEIVLKLLEQG